MTDKSQTIDFQVKLSGSNSFFLDLVRLLAAEAVLFGHGFSIFDVYPAFREPNFPNIQNTAVLIFFVLSGFLISYSTFRKVEKRSYPFKEYFIDRFSRIYCGLIPSLLLIGLTDWGTITFSPDPLLFLERFTNHWEAWDFVGNLLMLQENPVLIYIPGTYVSTFGSGVPLWTLVIEWWIYMSFGWFILAKTSNKVIYWTVGILASIVPFYNLVYGMESRGLGLTAVWLLGLGLTIFLKDKMIQQIPAARKLIWALTFLFASFLSLLVYPNGFHPLTGILYMASLLFFLLYFQGEPIRIAPLFSRLVQLGAGFSYTLYLIHFSILYFLKFVFPHHAGETNFWLGVLVANVLAFSLAWYTEMRYRTISDKLKQLFVA